MSVPLRIWGVRRVHPLLVYGDLFDVRDIHKVSPYDFWRPFGVQRCIKPFVWQTVQLYGLALCMSARGNHAKGPVAAVGTCFMHVRTTLCIWGVRRVHPLRIYGVLFGVRDVRQTGQL